MSRFTLLDDLHPILHHQIVGFYEKPLYGFGVHHRSVTALPVCEFAVALPDGAAVLVGGVPDLGTEEGTAILADQFGRKDALAAVGFAQSLPSGELCLNLLPFVRLNDGGMTARHIILWDFTLVGLHFLFQKIHRKLLLEQCITLVFFVLKDTGDRGLAPCLFAAR